VTAGPGDPAAQAQTAAAPPKKRAPRPPRPPTTPPELRPLPPEPRRALLTGLLLLAFTVGLLSPGLADLGGTLIGDPQSDTIRGLWGLDTVRRSMVPPNAWLFTREMNFPFGGWALILPYASSVLLSPLLWAFGPMAGWNLAVLGWLWMTAMGMATWVRARTGSWAAGLGCGAALLGQPMLLAAVAEGTPEHFAFGGLLFALAALEHARRAPSGRAAAGAALLGALVALESPYQAVYLVVFALPALPGLLAALKRQPWPVRLRALGAGLLVSALAIGLLAWLFTTFSAQMGAVGDLAAQRSSNSVDLVRWWQLEHRPALTRDPTLPPTAIPSLLLGGALLLALPGLRRGWVGLLPGLLFLGLSLGEGTAHEAVFEGWLGGPGRAFGEGLTAFNRHLYDLPGLLIIRFPRRLLVPAAIGLLLAAGEGLAALERRLPPGPPSLRRAGPLALCGLLGLLGLGVGARAALFWRDFPKLTPPHLAAADFIRASEVEGAVAVLPERRGSLTRTERHNLPVFASLGAELVSADLLYIQVSHGRPQTSFPELLTLRPRDRSVRARSELQAWDDLALPMTMGQPVPPSAEQDIKNEERKPGRDLLFEEGLRFLFIDRALYGDAELDILRRHLGEHIVREQAFEDGTGVLVMVLQP
jgi:hypothetical protein